MQKTNPRAIDPANDGKLFINIYSKGATRLGRLLTNLADVPVEHPVYGRFRTAEGLWYYLKTGCNCEALRSMSGFDAKKVGREREVVWLDCFQEEFKIAVKWKIEHHEELRMLFVESTLPFEHYYVYESKRPDVPSKVIEPSDVKWLTEYFEELRKVMRAEV